MDYKKMNLKLFYQYYSINEFTKKIQEKKSIKDSYNTYVNVYPFVKFDSIESENYWEYCKFSLITYKPFDDNIFNLVGDNQDPSKEDWIQAWVEFREENKNTLNYDMFMHIKKEIDSE